MNMIKSSLLTVESYTRLSLIYKRRERTIYVHTLRMYKRVDVRVAHIFYQKRRREQKKSFSFLSLVLPSLPLLRRIDFFLSSLPYRERDTRDILLLKQEKKMMNDKIDSHIYNRLLF